MSERSIYLALRRNGLSPAGACGVMGNMCCESTLVSYRVQGDFTDGYTKSRAYTRDVDNGSISGNEFAYDKKGYGLCQWTFWSRKQELYQLAKSRGVSVGDEAMQVEFCLKEMKRDFSSLYSYLQLAEDLFTAASRFCKEFEKPAVKNVYDRYEAAKKYYDRREEYEAGGEEEPEPPQAIDPDPCPSDQSTGDVDNQYVDGTKSTEICVRILGYGCRGRDVFMLQCGLTDAGFNCGVPDGEFFSKTRDAVKAMQRACNLEVTGIAGQDVWQVLFQ